MYLYFLGGDRTKSNTNLVEIIKLHRGDGSSDSGGDGFTGVAHEVRNGKQSSRISRICRGLYVKVPEGR